MEECCCVPEKDGYDVVVLENAPIILTNRVTGDKVALCRCGQSANNPFCDGSHKGAGFVGATVEL